MKPKVLILCTGNSCRSHMAEGILKHAASDLFEVYSAGSNPAGYVHPKAIEVMRELDIDVSAHQSEHLDVYLDSGIDIVVTVCGAAQESCPAFPGKVTRFHWPHDDPAKAVGSEEEIMRCFRAVRDQIKNTFEAFAAGYRQGKGA